MTNYFTLVIDDSVSSWIPVTQVHGISYVTDTAIQCKLKGFLSLLPAYKWKLMYGSYVLEWLYDNDYRLTCTKAPVTITTSSFESLMHTMTETECKNTTSV